MPFFGCCCPCLFKNKRGTVAEREPLIKRQGSADKLRENFQKFRKIVLENSLKDFDEVKEDVRDVTILLPPVGVGNVDAELSGYATLYNDHLERWKNLKEQLNDFKKQPGIIGRGRVVTFRNSLSSLHKTCDDIKQNNGDLNISVVSEYCLVISYKAVSEEATPESAAISAFNQLTKSLREFLERGPSLARLLKSVAGGVRFENVSPKKTSRESDSVVEAEPAIEALGLENASLVPTDPLSQNVNGDEVPSGSSSAVCPPSSDLTSSISKAGLSKEQEALALMKFKSNMELLGKAASTVEVLDLAAKSLWQNIHDELAEGAGR